ncbi:MAG: sugar phosphate nucleotidyltransferase [Desulfosalsimonas sp.]|uniref:sugar phosphate nucleotidyltransferase n=1 Tax=Desulfosalsimonas sp. TaxID=3073848 RepID=UPI003970F802
MPDNAFNALILAAGLGTRLRPHSLKVPKPLFAVAGRPVIDIIISRLVDAGVSTIAVNVFHLPDQITGYIASRNYPVPVICRREPYLLGTGGAIGHFSDMLGHRPFVMINSDILTDISIADVVRQHSARGPAATLVMHDHPDFNKVVVDPEGSIAAFTPPAGQNQSLMAFTGLQVIDPVIYSYIEPKQVVSSIDLFSAMIADGRRIEAYRVSGHYWMDLGTPHCFRQAVIDTMAPEIFQGLTGQKPRADDLYCRALIGDGSDRQWLRISFTGQSLIVADHGINTDKAVTEFDAFVAIGRHLFDKGVCVPKIHAHDRFSGLVFVADLGDTLLQQAVGSAPGPDLVEKYYKSIIDGLMDMHSRGSEGFDPDWAYQGAVYDRQMILEKEGRYFVAAFLQNYLEMPGIETKALESEFCTMADVISGACRYGFMHRDFQSRNIMVTPKGFFFIDFQAGRIGPLEYDLASLLTDPYVALAPELQNRLADYAMHQLGIRAGSGEKNFQKGYRCCAISRNLQALGAYGRLVREKGKTDFARYMPAALANLKRLTAGTADPPLPVLAKTVAHARRLLDRREQNSPAPGIAP